MTCPIKLDSLRRLINLSGFLLRAIPKNLSANLSAKLIMVIDLLIVLAV